MTDYDVNIVLFIGDPKVDQFFLGNPQVVQGKDGIEFAISAETRLVT